MRNAPIARSCFVVLAAAFLQSAPPSRADTITLQQGTNGCSGCSDSFIANGAYPDNRSQNYGSSAELRVWYGHYASW